MYKHRFRMWNVSKYRPRRPPGEKDKSHTAITPYVPVPGQPADVPQYHQALAVFLGIQDWVAGTVHVSATSPEPRRLQWDSDLTEVCEAFAFSSALFHRGYGHLAGKAFRCALAPRPACRQTYSAGSAGLSGEPEHAASLLFHWYFWGPWLIWTMGGTGKPSLPSRRPWRQTTSCCSGC